MKLRVAVGLALLLPGCSSNQNQNPVTLDGARPGATQGEDCGCVSPDVSARDAAPDVTSLGDAASDASTDATSDAASDATSDADAAESDAASDATSDADAAESDATCPTSWSLEPTVDPTISVPSDGGSVVLHATGTGTQNYACEPGSDGGLAWTFVGPQADLSDCHGQVIAYHFASEAGAAAPEWMLVADGSYVVGQKVAAFDGGGASIPWLLLRAVGHSDAGALGATTFVQRINTDGGLQPTSSCDIDSGIQMVPYAADYYFYAP